MIRGKKPVPTVLKVIHGNPGHRPLNQNEFKPTSGPPKCPRHLTGEARVEWNRLLNEFAAVGLVTGVDRGLLAMMCAAWGDHVAARKAMAEAAKQKGASEVHEKGAGTGKRKRHRLRRHGSREFLPGRP